MAKLVDASVSGAGPVKGVEVRVLFWAPFQRLRFRGFFTWGMELEMFQSYKL